MHFLAPFLLAISGLSLGLAAPLPGSFIAARAMPEIIEELPEPAFIARREMPDIEKESPKPIGLREVPDIDDELPNPAAIGRRNIVNVV